MGLPVSSNNSYSQNWGIVNNALRQIENEQVTKTFKQPGGNSIIVGRLPYGGTGILMYDSNNVARILIGTAPDDGRIGNWTTSEGKDVIDELNA